MYAPVFHSPAPAVSPAVLAEEAQIIAVEGRTHVCGRYYADERDAALQRRWEAERRVQEIARFANRCAWCGWTFQPDDRRMQAAGRDICEVPCSAEFEEFTTPRIHPSGLTVAEIVKHEAHLRRVRRYLSVFDPPCECEECTAGEESR